MKRKTGICAAAALGFGAAIMALSPAMREGVRAGLRLCGESVIPSLFLFTALALFVSDSGIGRAAGNLAAPVFRLLFRLDGEQAAVMAMSFLSGYPVGAKLIAGLYARGADRKQCLKMLTYCVNAGPAFIVIAVGSATLGSEADGRRLLIAHILSSLLIAAVVCRLPHGENRISPPAAPQSDKSVSDAFVGAVADAGAAMLSICAFVVFFSGIGGMLAATRLRAARSLLEVTVGIQDCTRSTLQKAAFLLGFGGISVIFQVMAAARELKPPVGLIFCSRILHGALSALLIAGMEQLFPRSLRTMSSGGPSRAAVHTSPAASAALLFLSAVLIFYAENGKKFRKPVEKP